MATQSHIFTLREALGMIQADLARESGLTPSSFRRIERSRRGMSLTKPMPNPSRSGY